jgi:ABC-type multidrug transport system fused ATPase/permease subunit
MPSGCHLQSTDSRESAIRLVRGLGRVYRLRIACALLLTAAACLLTLPVPVLVQRVVDGAVFESALPLPYLGGMLVSALILQATCTLAAALLIGNVAIDIAREIRRRVYEHLLQDEFNTSPGLALSRLTDDVACIQNLVSMPSISLFTDLGTAAVAAGYLFWQFPMWLAAAAIIAPISVLQVRFFSRRIRNGSLDVRYRLDRIFVQLQEKLDGAMTVKGHGREAAEEREFEAKMAAAHGPRIHLGRQNVELSMRSQLLSSLGAMIVFAVGAGAVIHGDLSPGMAVSAAALSLLLFGPLNRVAEVASAFQQAAASFRRLADFTSKQKNAVTEPPDPVRLDRAAGLIEFEGVGFAYQAGLPILSDFSLRVEPGEHVAVIGPTGCGKSTLLSLLLRFRDPDWGDVRLDGISLRRLSLANLRRQIGLVPQEPIVFRGTLADNIRYGDVNTGMWRVEAAALATGVDAIANRLPRGYDTIIGEGGHSLSAGERQRIAIARAICLDPPVILMDEATSQLDAFAEADIQTALQKLLRGRTAIIVAHRQSTVREADRVIELGGRRGAIRTDSKKPPLDAA